jgi:hypothetical protein
MLDIPDSEVLLSQHAPWSTEILAGTRVTPRGNLNVTAMPSLEPETEKTWETIFETDGYLETIQAVIDRIEPRWVLEPDLREHKKSLALLWICLTANAKHLIRRLFSRS